MFLEDWDEIARRHDLAVGPLPARQGFAAYNLACREPALRLQFVEDFAVDDCLLEIGEQPVFRIGLAVHLRLEIADPVLEVVFRSA